MNRFIDTHSHILYGVDDGAVDESESILMLQKMVNLGFERIILTPHYRKTYQTNNSLKQSKFEMLEKVIENNHLNVKIYLANEIRITGNIEDLIQSGDISILGNNIFLEFPFDKEYPNYQKVIYNLQLKGLNVILVHPERYCYFKKNDYQYLIQHDVEFQVNYLSIIGYYGFDAYKKVKWLLKNHLVTYFGTDIHHFDDKYEKKFNKSIKKIKKIINDEEFANLVYNNIETRLDNI